MVVLALPVFDLAVLAGALVFFAAVYAPLVFIRLDAATAGGFIRQVFPVYYLTMVLTELVSNNAVAVIMAPIAIALAAAVGIDSRPLVIAVMIAASASFATPIGYQTNMLVYGPGGYKFSDFLKVGIPLNLSIGLLASLLIPMIWPL